MIYLISRDFAFLYTLRSYYLRFMPATQYGPVGTKQQGGLGMSKRVYPNNICIDKGFLDANKTK